MQDALVWLGFYNGVVDGDFGRRTRDAILAFQASAKAPADGALSALELQALLASAQKARDAVGFRIVSDAKSGARIGAPAKLLSARSGVRLEFASSADPDLSALYARLTAVTPARKIAYKAIKPDAFFVVSGQDGASNFYTRFDNNAAASPPIRGFTFAYPSSQAAQLDRVALAVANSFEPFPQLATTPADSAATGAAVAPGSGSAPPAPNPAPAATALVVAPGRALTALKADDCPNPTVDGKPVRVERTDAATNLAMIAGDFGPKGEPPRFGAPGPDVVVLGFAGPRLAASPASLSGGGRGPPSSPQWRRAGAADRCSIGAARWSDSWRRSRARPSASPGSRSPPRTPSLPPTPSAPSLARVNPRPSARPTSAPATSPRARRRRSSPSSARGSGGPRSA